MNPGNNLHKAIRLYDAAERQTSHHRRRYSHKFGLFALPLRSKTFSTPCLEILREEGWTQNSEEEKKKEKRKEKKKKKERCVLYYFPIDCPHRGWLLTWKQISFGSLTPRPNFTNQFSSKGAN